MITEGMRVRVHMNLRDKSFTVSTYRKGIGWRKATPAQRVLLRDVEFKVSLAGKKRAMETGRRNVHAYAYGTLGSWVDIFPKEDIPLFGSVQVRYNPFRDYTFVSEHLETVREAEEVLFSMKHGVQAWGVVN